MFRRTFQRPLPTVGVTSPRYENHFADSLSVYLIGSVFSPRLKSFIPISPISRRRSVWEDRNLPFSNRAQVCPKLDVDGAATVGKNQVVAYSEATQVNGCWACTLRTCTSGGLAAERTGVLFWYSQFQLVNYISSNFVFSFSHNSGVGRKLKHTLINAGPDSAAQSLIVQLKPEKKPRMAFQVDYPVRFSN